VKIFPHVASCFFARCVLMRTVSESKRHCIGIFSIVAGDAVALIAFAAISASRGRGFRRGPGISAP